ncbi:M23 family metallopeptidase [Terricaulis sp.]|uniref:M23 family metallopeptidase n=1 Tax=Terricaulis sp. TaxID=2768686 RepID=UPI00378301F3
MLRKLIFCVIAMGAAGCATHEPYGAGVTAPLRNAPPPVPQVNIYTTAPRAALQSELIACNRGTGSNIGAVGIRYESLAYTPYIQTAAGALLRDPAENACLSSGFGWRGASAVGGSGEGREHGGIDLANPSGGFVYAAADGWISRADWFGGYGLTLEIDHGHGVRTLYAHLSEVDQNLAPGMFVSAGQPVARMGMTGNATGIHLHYEVSIDGLKVDPLNYGAPPAYEVTAVVDEKPLD